MTDEIDFSGLLDALSAQEGSTVRVEIGIRENMEPLSDFTPAVLCGRLGAIQQGEDIGHGRGVASLRIGDEGSRVRLDATRFRWAELRSGAVKADLTGSSLPLRGSSTLVSFGPSLPSSCPPFVLSPA